MNILILNWRDIKHPLAGGAEISLFEHAKYWRKMGAHVTWFTSSFQHGQKEEIIDGIKIIRRGSHNSVHLWAFFYIIVGKFIRQDIVIDSIHFIPFFTPIYIRNSHVVALINEPAKNAWFKNIIFPFNLLGYFSERFFFVFYKKTVFITGSNSIAKEIMEYGIERKKIIVIEHGISAEKTKVTVRKEKYPTVIFLGQMTQDKGIEDAIQAFYMTQKIVKNIKLWIVGKERNKKLAIKMRNLVKALHISQKVIFNGYVSENKKMNLLSRSWVLLHPSIREGWGLNVIEANFYGTPVIGYNVVGLRDSIKHQQTGLLVDMNPIALSDALKELFKNKQLYEQLSRNAKDWAKKFSWEESTKKSWNLLQEIQRKCTY